MGYNKIILQGNQTSDYLYIESSPKNGGQFEYENFKAVNSEPIDWSENTLLLAKFNGNLVAGDSSLTDNIEGYEVRRQRGANPYTEYVATIPKDSKKYMIDYLVANNENYTYYLYPSIGKSSSGVLLSPSITDEIKTDWGYWSLLVVDETEEENVFYLNKMFKFELNVTTDDMSNNAAISVIPNFTKYPTVQYGTSNYWSSALTSLCGFLSSNENDIEYVQTPNMIKELKALTSDTRRKFLKDVEGNIWEVKITSPIGVSSNEETLQKIKSVKVGWTEVGEVSGVSIINNPNSSSVSWVLTESGVALPYIEYVWDEHYRWDNSYRWTSNDAVLETSSFNMGRNSSNEERDE